MADGLTVEGWAGETGDVRPGRYRHYKGREYRVIGVARHSETEEALVVYQPLYEGAYPLWVRPLAMFVEDVGGVPRFARVGD